MHFPHLSRFFPPPQQDSEASTKSVQSTGLEAMGVEEATGNKTWAMESEKTHSQSPTLQDSTTAYHQNESEESSKKSVPYHTIKRTMITQRAVIELTQGMGHHHSLYELTRSQVYVNWIP